MNADRYQTEAARTLIDKPEHEIPGHDMMLVWVALGLTGEAGEVAEHVKKGVLHQHGVDRDKLVKELGDVAWYLAGLATLIGVPLSEVFERNIAKLRERYPNGYSSEDSKARVDTTEKCANCGLPIDNLSGKHLISSDDTGNYYMVCTPCYKHLLHKGYGEVARAK